MNDQGTGRSKRQRIFDLMKTTKDVYIPTISNTISQLASEATTRALNYAEGADIPAGDVAINTNTKGAQILLYPHFTRRDPDFSTYYTQVHGWVYTTEGSVRKKKIILSLAKQLAKSSNGAVSDMAAMQFDDQLNGMQDDETSTISSSASENNTRSLRRTNTASSTQSELSTGSSQSETDDVLRERIANFVNRSLGNTELRIAVGGSHPDELVTVDLLTDNNGNFNQDVNTPFKPEFIQVAIANDEKIFALTDTIFPGRSPFGVISDIDDTIKYTGICTDKRRVFRNTFADNMESWEINGAADTYRYLYQKYDMSFFYVSNSPYQLYSNLKKYFNLFEFPEGSMYLKRYSGNILNSLFEPSHTRKKAPLERIVEHFSDKKFFLIGDSSEQDLEAYTDIARSHPDRIAGIYIRIADNSMSEDTFHILKEILNKRRIPTAQETTEEVRQKLEQLDAAEEDLIDLSDDITSNISKDRMDQIINNSKEKSEKVDQGREDLEEGSVDAFFATSHGSSTPTNSRSQPHILLLSTKLKPPPKVPTKPKYLQSVSVDSAIPTTAPSSAPSTSSTTSAGQTLPPLPRRPVPVPPPRSSIQIARTEPLPPQSQPQPSNTTNFNNEETEEWVSRLLTALLILRKAGDGKIQLRFFVEFNEIQEDIVNYMKIYEQSK